MKNKKKDVFGRTYTKSGYIRHIALIVIGVTAFVVLIGLTGSCDIRKIAVGEYAVVAIPCLVILVGSVLLHNKIFK